MRRVPCGHGDVFHCLHDSVLMDKLLAQGQQFISNIGDLGAIVDLKRLNNVASEDREGRRLSRRRLMSGRATCRSSLQARRKLLEAAQVPASDLGDFRIVELFGQYQDRQSSCSRQQPEAQSNIPRRNLRQGFKAVVPPRQSVQRRAHPPVRSVPEGPARSGRPR